MAWARSDLQTSENPAHLLSASMRLHEGEEGFPPVPSVQSLVVKRIVVLRNQQMWDAYDDVRQQFQQRAEVITKKLKGNLLYSNKRLFKEGVSNGLGAHPLFDGFPVIDESVAETLLFHGTSATRHIVATNINPSFGRNKGTALAPNYGLLGQGAYFSDQIAKSATYTLCRMCQGFKCNCTAKDGTPVLRMTLVARVLLGRIHNAPSLTVLKDREGLRQQTFDTPIRNGSDSIMASGGGLKWAAGSNEFAIRNIQQIYPEFIVYWHHPAPPQPYAGLWDNASRVAMAQRQQRRQAKQVQREQELDELDGEKLAQGIADLFGA